MGSNFISRFCLCLVLLVAMFTVASCSKDEVKKITADTITNALTGATVTVLTCENVVAVKADVKVVVDKWFQDKQMAGEKGIVNSMCKMAVTEVVPKLIGNAVPASWNCKLTTVDNAAELLAGIACSAIKF